MSEYQPVAFTWDGGAMIPLDRFRRLASQQFRPGKEYSLIPHMEQSDKERGLYNACITLTWENLPDTDQQRFPSDTHLRRWCLVREGYADEHSMICDNEAKARATAALCRKLDSFAVITVKGPIVTVWTAKSQSKHNMGHQVYHESVTKVLERCADMLGISVNELTDNAKSRMGQNKRRA